MSAVDFHQILGLPQGASAAEIKRAYRRLAMRWHPDRNPDPQAHDQFRLVREAFERLIQAASPSPGEAPPQTGSPEPRRPKGEDRRMEISLGLAEAARGCSVTISVESRSACSDCEGSGKRSYGRTTMCGACHGSGRIRGANGLSACQTCAGKGFTTDCRCPGCEGRGWLPANRQLDVRIPPGLLPGEEVRVTGQGGPAPQDGEPGDLYLRLSIDPHPLFRLEHLDVHVQVPVSIFRLLAGGQIEVPTLDGIREILLPEAFTEPRFRLTGAGYPGRGARSPGDLIAHFETQLPRFLTKEQKAMLDMAEQVFQHQLDDQNPTLARWQATLETHR
ncbi:DnaJ C-terminal domain-containing protein [Zoogloea sp.]|uniref:DnaJ C-terminal domain-containing protein n=1 Tax=Zoogloea sp. TaxID=49181 RepID=UPI00260333FA|nr:DnaJ C-terminal domain-containing protein [Zoogloea sp.]MDD3354806.1 DnaJ C-terminal domain-containing protein [Zoogloea sp.]